MSNLNIYTIQVQLAGGRRVPSVDHERFCVSFRTSSVIEWLNLTEFSGFFCKDGFVPPNHLYGPNHSSNYRTHIFDSNEECYGNEINAGGQDSADDSAVLIKWKRRHA